MVSFIGSTKDKEISSLTEISDSNMVKPTLKPTEKPMVEPSETPIVQPSVTQTAESTATPTIVTDKSNALKTWTGDYVYNEYCPPDENMIYSLSIYEEDENYYAEITIYGFQTNQLIRAKVIGDDKSINILFDK